MQKQIFTLVLVVTMGVLIGVAVVKNQIKQPLLREILQKQEAMLLAQGKMERAIDTGEAFGAKGPSRTAQRLDVIENRLSALEAQMRGLQAGNAAENVRQAPPAEDLSTVYTIPVAHSPVRGNKNAPVVIVEFVDFECPFCARFHAPILEVLKAYPKDVAYILKNFPLSFHQKAKPAAKAAFAAGEQGKYWEMADALLESGRSLNDETFKKIAEDLGLNVNQFMDDYIKKDDVWEKYIEEDFALGQQINVRGTPTFYINGRKTNARDFNGLKREIDAILNEKK